MGILILSVAEEVRSGWWDQLRKQAERYGLESGKYEDGSATLTFPDKPKAHNFAARIAANPGPVKSIYFG